MQNFPPQGIEPGSPALLYIIDQQDKQYTTSTTDSVSQIKYL